MLSFQPDSGIRIVQVSVIESEKQIGLELKAAPKRSSTGANWAMSSFICRAAAVPRCISASPKYRISSLFAPEGRTHHQKTLTRRVQWKLGATPQSNLHAGQKTGQNPQLNHAFGTLCKTDPNRISTLHYRSGLKLFALKMRKIRGGGGDT